MNVAFLSEMRWKGKVPSDHPNARTEFCWMYALNATHFNIYDYKSVQGFDVVFIIFPKGTVSLNAVGADLQPNQQNTDSKIFASDIIESLKLNNKKVCFIQEGPCWFFNDYSLVDQFNYYNQLSSCDILFSHNEKGVKWYKGLFPGKRVEVIPTLMIDNTIKNVKWEPENKVMIGGNMSRWYGGFQSYLVSDELKAEKWLQTSHSSRPGEEMIPDVKVLPRLIWTEWMKSLSKFKYGINLMPTEAAGTFSLNCAYFGIPCIGNKDIDTQNQCHPNLSFDVEDIESARKAAQQLYSNPDFYTECSNQCSSNYKSVYSVDSWIQKMSKSLDESPVKISDNGVKQGKITAVFTSCGRFDLMDRTLKSFLKHTDVPVDQFIVIDNSTLPSAKKSLENIFSGLPSRIIINSENIGQVSSIDKAYSFVDTEYIFHCEDDWEFFDYGFMSKSIDVLNHDSSIVNVNLRVRFDGEKGSMHPVSNAKSTKNGIVYHEYLPGYLEVWHGFSWNPGLRKLCHYDLVKPYKQHLNENGVGNVYKQMGFKSACLEKFYCKHIGVNGQCQGANT